MKNDHRIKSHRTRVDQKTRDSSLPAAYRADEPDTGKNNGKCPTPGKILLITGDRGAGKTTWCAGQVKAAQSAGQSTGGVLCPGHFEHGRKYAFDLVDLRTDERRLLGQLRDEQDPDRTVGRWFLDENVTAWGNDILAQSAGVDLLVVDELGPLEFEQGLGFQEGMTLLDRGAFGTALVVVRPELIEAALARWPNAEVVHVEAFR